MANKTLTVGEACLCFHMQRAARALARVFDDVFRPLDLTNGQFTLMMSLSKGEPKPMGRIADVRSGSCGPSPARRRWTARP